LLLLLLLPLSRQPWHQESTFADEKIGNKVELDAITRYHADAEALAMLSELCFQLCYGLPHLLQLLLLPRMCLLQLVHQRPQARPVHAVLGQHLLQLLPHIRRLSLQGSKQQAQQTRRRLVAATNFAVMNLASRCPLLGSMLQVV
jgi:hypothetical protein